jgi:lipoprotein-releasing system ATP-binding protein
VSIISGENIVRKFGNLEVVKGVNIDIKQGEIVCITGKSGAGKSTLLHILGLLDTADQGVVKYKGNPIGNLNEKKKSEFRNKNIGFVFQFHHLLPEFTALENICIPAFIKKTSRKEAEEIAMYWLKYLGLENRATHKPSELSGGEQQRVAMARALINEPLVILADEPTGNLDSKTGNEMHELFLKLQADKNQTFVIVTHNKELAKMATREIKMNDGYISTEEF